jgi:hypothetical protein
MSVLAILKGTTLMARLPDGGGDPHAQRRGPHGEAQRQTQIYRLALGPGAHAWTRRHPDGRVIRDSSQMACGQEYGSQQA